MLKQNNIPVGVFIGLVLPVTSVIVFELLMNSIWITANRGTPYFVVAAINLLVMRYFAAKHQDKTVQGIILVTLVFVISVYLLRIKP